MPANQPSSAQLSQAYQALSSLKQPTSEQWAQISARIKLKCLQKKNHFLHAGDTATEVALVSSGLMRMYYLTENGKEFNRGFVAENALCAAHASLSLKQPSQFSIQALEPTELLVMQPTDLGDMSYWREVQLLSVEQIFFMKEQREAQFLLDPPETRYLAFVNDHPELTTRLPDHHIASYIGITPVHLSRIKNALQ